MQFKVDFDFPYISSTKRNMEQALKHRNIILFIELSLEITFE